MKRLLVLSVGLLASSAMFGEVAPVQCEKHAPYSDIASVMRDGTVLDIIGSIPGVREIRDPVEKLGEVVKRLEKIDIDLCKLAQAGSDVYKKALCLKADEAKRKASPACGTVDCNGSRIACIVKTLEKVKMMVAIIVQDFFLGYQDGNTKVDGMIYLMLDVVGRKNAGDLKTKVDPILEKALNVLGVIEDLLKKIPATTTPATTISVTTAPATIKASAPTTEK